MLLDRYYQQYKQEVIKSIDIPEESLLITIETINQLKKYFTEAVEKIDQINNSN